MPVVGGNVSLYNETEQGPIYPTPVVGMVGELPDPERAGGIALTDGDAIAVCGPFSPSLAGLGAGEAARRSRPRACRRCRSPRSRAAIEFGPRTGRARAACAPPTT